MDNEKVIIESEKDSSISVLLLIVTAILAIITISAFTYLKQDKEYYEATSNLAQYTYISSYKMQEMQGAVVKDVLVIIVSLIATVGAVIAFFFTKDTKLVVTDKKVFGTAAFNKQVDIPIDSISAVGKSFLSSIAVSSSSGKIFFAGLKNQKEVYSAINELLVARQENKKSDNNNGYVLSGADEIKKLKELLDSGIITQEEFDAKKKQLLGL